MPRADTPTAQFNSTYFGGGPADASGPTHGRRGGGGCSFGLGRAAVGLIVGSTQGVWGRLWRRLWPGPLAPWPAMPFCGGEVERGQ